VTGEDDIARFDSRRYNYTDKHITIKSGWYPSVKLNHQVIVGDEVGYTWSSNLFTLNFTAALLF
jgi:hypothetical protein